MRMLIQHGEQTLRSNTQITLLELQKNDNIYQNLTQHFHISSIKHDHARIIDARMPPDNTIITIYNFPSHHRLIKNFENNNKKKRKKKKMIAKNRSKPSQNFSVFWTESLN